MKIRTLPTFASWNWAVFDAYIWHQNGDHPQDSTETLIGSDGQPFQSEGKVVRYYRLPDVPGEQICDLCDRTMHEHGWIDKETHYHPSFMPKDNRVCPGGTVITGDAGYYSVCAKDFGTFFEVIPT